MSDSDELNYASSNDEDTEDINEDDRTLIRKELSTLSFEELQKLKERIGAKVYKEAIFGNGKKEKDDQPKVFKRENKNRPREMSSKKPVPVIRDVVKAKKTEIRDPRFDPLCGDFDKKQFKEDYSFLSSLRSRDIQSIRVELKKNSDPDKEVKLRRLLQRLTEQQRDNKRKKIEREQIVKEKKQVEEEFKEGRQPRFKNKSERRVEDLVKQYEQLKSGGANRIQRHLKRRQQKVKKKSHRAPVGAL